MITKESAINGYSNDIKWTVDIETAKTIRKYINKNKPSKGSWIYINIVTPVNVAVRRKLDNATFYSSSFSNCEVAKILHEATGYTY